MYNRFSQWDLSIFLPSQHWTVELHQGYERAITRSLRVSSVCVSDAPPPSRTQVDGRPKCTCEPGEHGSELTARCSKWDQPHEANPALRWEVNQNLTTLLTVVGTEEAQLCSSPCPSDVPTSHRSSGKWHSCITTESQNYPWVALHAALHQRHSYWFTLMHRDQKAAQTSWHCPLKKPISCEDSHRGFHSSSGISPKWWFLKNGIKGRLGHREASSQNKCFYSAEDILPLSHIQARSQPSAGKFILFPLPGQFRSVLEAKRSGGQSDSWNEKCDGKKGIK